MESTKFKRVQPTMSNLTSENAVSQLSNNNNNTMLKCLFCDKLFLLKIDLLHHKQQFHSNTHSNTHCNNNDMDPSISSSNLCDSNPPYFSCYICKNQFKSILELQQHSTTHFL